MHPDGVGPRLERLMHLLYEWCGPLVDRTLLEQLKVVDKLERLTYADHSAKVTRHKDRVGELQFMLPRNRIPAFVPGCVPIY